MQISGKREMKRLFAGALACATLAAGCGTEDAAPDAPNVERSPQSVLERTREALPEGYVETPIGRYHASCVHEVPEGGEVDLDGTIRVGSQVVRAPARCAFKSFRNRPDAARSVSEGVARLTSPLLLHDWVSYVEAPANNLGVFPIRFNGIESTLTVPQTPTVQVFQLLYLFVSLTPADGQAILQPVFRYSSADGPPKWTVAGWYYDRNDNGFHSPYVNVSPGEAIKGTIRDVRNSCVGTNCSWDVKLYRGNSAITSLRVSSNEAYAMAQKAVLEVQDVTTCRQLPSTNALFLSTKVYAPYDPSNVDARVDVTSSLNWKTHLNYTDCGLNAVVPNPQTAVLTWRAN